MRITIKFNKPNYAAEKDIVDFICDALETWGGTLHPEDPLFHSLKIEEIKVHRGSTYVKAPKKLVIATKKEVP